MSSPCGEFVRLINFRAELGQVTGHGVFRIPTRYARWGTSDYTEIELSLKAIDEVLRGIISEDGVKNKIELKKS